MIAALLLCCSAPPLAPLDEPAAAALVAKLASDDGAGSAAALKELTAAGPAAKAAVPALVKLLAPEHPKRYEAVAALGAIGPGAKGAVPALLALLPKDGFGGYAAERISVTVAALDGLKPECTRALLMTSAKCTPIYLEQSALLETHPADVVRHLCGLCADPDAKVRERAALVLARGNRNDGKVRVPTLFERAGAAAQLVPAALEKLLADSSYEVRLAGARAATVVAPELADKAVAVAVELAKGRVGKVKDETDMRDVFAYAPDRAAAQLLPLFDSTNEALSEWAVVHASYLPVRTKLEAVLKGGATARARAGAARALGRQNADGVPALKAALNDPAFEVRFAAAEGLTSVGGAARAAGVPALVEGLSADAGTRERACRLLLGLHAAAKPAVPDLRQLLKDPVREVRFAAALALAGIDAKGAAGAVPALTDALTGTEPDARRAAAALGAIGAPAKDAVPELAKHFGAPSAQLRIASASAAARIDPARAPDAVKVLTGVLADPKLAKGLSRLRAVQALVKIGAPAKGALPVLAQLLTGDHEYRAEVAVAMLALDPESAAGREWVRAALAHKSASNEDAYDLFNALSDAPAVCALLVADLIPTLAVKEAFYRRGAAEALGAAGAAAKPALPKLKELAAKDPNAGVRNAAREAVEQIEGK